MSPVHAVLAAAAAAAAFAAPWAKPFRCHMSHPVGRSTVGAQPSPLPLAGTGGSSSLEGNDPVTMGTHKTLCVVECGGMDAQGSQTLAPTRSAWPILCLRIVRVCGMAPPPLRFISLQ